MMKHGVPGGVRLVEWIVASLFVLVAVIAVWHSFDVFTPYGSPRQRATFLLDGSPRQLATRQAYGPPWRLRNDEYGYPYRSDFKFVEIERPFHRLGLQGELEIVQTVPLLLLASLAVAVGYFLEALRSRRPLGRSLGLALSLASVLGALAGGGLMALGHRLHGSRAPQATLDALESAVIGAGWMVFGAWIVLAIAGRGLPRLAKLDILGTFVGGVWLLLLGYAVG